MKSLTISKDMSPANLLETFGNLNQGLTKPRSESVIIELYMTVLETLPEAALLYRNFTNIPEYTNGDWDPVLDVKELQRLVTKAL